jgi:hypothetical protein
MIPGASKAATVNAPAPNSICGNGAGLVSAMGKIAKTICSKLKPQKSWYGYNGRNVLCFHFDLDDFFDSGNMLFVTYLLHNSSKVKIQLIKMTQNVCATRLYTNGSHTNADDELALQYPIGSVFRSKKV